MNYQKKTLQWANETVLLVDETSRLKVQQNTPCITI